MILINLYPNTLQEKERHRQKSAVYRAVNPEKHKEATTRWRKNNPEKHRLTIRRWHMFKKFGIDQEEYGRMFEEQKGLCAICLQPEKALFKGKVKQLAVDHNHTTGRIRALLCSACNQAIGHMRDSPDRLRAAATYLEKFR